MHIKPLTGDIKVMTIPQLFQDLRLWKKTGTAVFENGETIKKVYFQDGDVVFASSNINDERLGECLLREGKITTPQYNASAELVIKTKKKQGAILVELGFITPKDLIEGVRSQIKQIVLSLLVWRSGKYSFDEGPLPLSDIIPLQMSIGSLILNSARDLDWQAVRKSLPPLKTALRLSSDPAILFQNAAINDDQRTVLSLVDGKRSIEEICSLSGIGDFNTIKSAYLLLMLRMVEEGEIKTGEDASFAREAVHAAVGPAAGGAGEGASEQAATREMIIKAYEVIASQDHYEVLGVDGSAKSQDIKKAYFRLAKLYHPDRHFEHDMHDLKDKLHALFTRINKAYEAISSEAMHKEYDLALTKVVKAKKAETTSPAATQNKTRTAAEQYENGLKEYRVGNYWGAVESFTWACRLDPMKSKYFYHQGIALMHMPRRRHEAEDSFLKAIEIDPSKADYHFELGNLYLQNNMKARALTALKQAAELDPDSEKIRKALSAAGGGMESREPKEAVEEKKPGGGVLKKLFGGDKK